MSENIDLKTLVEINSILELDSKTASYKFALLRGIIDIIYEYPQLIRIKGDIVEIPFGMLVFNWIYYYYPILTSKNFIPQIVGESKTNQKLGIRNAFAPVISYYNNFGGIDKLYNDINSNNIPNNIQDDITLLAKKIAKTIKDQPMRYLGKSYFNKEYSFVQCNSCTHNLPANFLLTGVRDYEKFGFFSLSSRYYNVLKSIGGYIIGSFSLLPKWSDFTKSISKNSPIDQQNIFDLLIKPPGAKRNMRIISDKLKELASSHICVWTGKQTAGYHIDHIIPFSIWPNNFLWNLLPSSSSVNISKSDKIPSPEILNKSKDRLFDYWKIYLKYFENSFKQEVLYSLNNNQFTADVYLDNIFTSLVSKCEYFINLGYRPWKI